MKHYQLQGRRGASMIEMGLVFGLIIAILIAGIYIFGDTVKGIYGMSKNVSVINGSSGDSGSTMTSDSTTASAAESEVASRESALRKLDATVEEQRRISAFTALIAGLNALCVVVVGYIYLRFIRRKNASKEVCEVEIQQEYSDAMSRILKKRNRIHSDLRENWIQLFKGQASIEPYMSTNLETVRPDMPLTECAKLLNEKGYRRFMVTDGEGRLKGVISRKDIKSKQGQVVSDIMTNQPKTGCPNTSLRVALTILLQHRVSCLPVVDDEKLVGLLSTSDLMIVLQCILVLLDSAGSSLDTPTKTKQKV